MWLPLTFLGLLAFELRFVSRRQPPDRWVVDLGRDDEVLLLPQAYLRIPNPEDRLVVPAEYVPPWEQHGWKRRCSARNPGLSGLRAVRGGCDGCAGRSTPCGRSLA
jgi:hypothetical protein